MKKLASIIAIVFVLAIIPGVAYGQWSFETVDTAGDVGYYCDIAVDIDGHPHIVYYDWDNWHIKYAHWDGAAWGIELADTLAWGSPLSIALDSLGNPHISCELKFPGYYYGLGYIWWDGTTWQRIALGSGYFADIGVYSAIVIDATDHPHIAYTDYPTTDLAYLKYTYGDATGWHTVIVDSIEGIINGVKFCDMALDGMGNPHISYFDRNATDLKYAHWDGTTWHIERVDTADWVGEYSSIALDSLGYPHIAYWDGTNYGVKYVRWDGGAWQIETVESDVGYGFYTSLALDANDRPHISSAEYMSDLRFAYWDGSIWQTEVVDNTVTCRWTSLAIDDAGYIHIAYYDETSGAEELRYARRIPTGIEETYPILEVLHLVQNYPNPFRERTVISYQLPGVGTGLVSVRLKIYDISGSLVRTLVDQDLKPDTYHLSWDGRDEQGMEVNSGVYFSRLSAGGVKDTKKMILLR